MYLHRLIKNSLRYHTDEVLCHLISHHPPYYESTVKILLKDVKGTNLEYTLDPRQKINFNKFGNQVILLEY